ncbi:regulatory protein TetR [Gordonia neofelifaecis NRRL B-59395]|uniref:Regulatory protein TetR n=1 Tax=Gordonia neofelifaecis NRRL B-59395 TaxID=644548 RepID=F1YHA8_9ACTN|nr:regulatory protein TetR [Gordonia neofelifaecis NRRL B-59395]
MILTAAARSFAEHGFHATRLGAVAEEAGISAPALYKHFSGKYELFAAALIDLAEQLAAAAAAVPTDDDPRRELLAVIRAMAGNALDNRETGNIYRREPRLLQGDDRRRLAELSAGTRERLVALLGRARPVAPERTVRLLVTAALSIVASPVTHRVGLARRAVLDTLCGTVETVVELDLPDPATAADSTGLTPLGRREAVLTESIKLFASRGFHEVTLEEIGAAVDLPPSGVYRHFSSKNAILTAALWRGSERTTAAIADGLANATTPNEALVALAAEYSSLCVSDPEIMAVYLRDMGALDVADRRALRRQQRLNVDEWATWLQRARPDVAPAAARFLVHAALNVATDLTIAYRDLDASTAAVVVAAVLTGD